MKKFVCLVIIVFIGWANVSLASTDSSRIRLLIHGKYELAQQPLIQLRAHFMVVNLAADKLVPVGLLGVGFNPATWLDIEPSLGYNFAEDELITCLRVKSGTEQFYTYLDLQYRSESQMGYWFFQAEYIVQPWLQLGLEEESWGDLKDWETLSHGWGPNVLVRLNNFGLDLAWHQRQDGEKGEQYSELFARVHVFH